MAGELRVGPTLPETTLEWISSIRELPGWVEADDLAYKSS